MLRDDDCRTGNFARVRQQRHREIVRRLEADGATSVDELSRALGVSPSTIRRDLSGLDGSGRLVRVHGGALTARDGGPDADADRPFGDVVTVDAPAKLAVARRAAAMVSDGDAVLLDIGTTTQQLARELRGRRITVMTASLAVLDVLRDDPAVELVLLGGSVRRAYHSLTGVLTADALRQVHADIAFLGAAGVRRDGEVLDTTLVEVPVKRALIRACDRAVLLADEHKLPGSGSLRVCGAADLHALVTNEGADHPTLQAFRDEGVDVMTA